MLAALANAGCVAPAPKTAETEALPPPASFVLAGQPFCFVGANSYSPIYEAKPAVDELFDAARALDLKVLRIWGMLERGSLDGSVPNADGAGHKQGVYFQYWDHERARPAYNDGPDGLERLDYALAAAAARDLKLIVVLLNNWRDFGGVDQYLMWYGRARHHEFFTAPETRAAYRAWLEHVITRKNSVNSRLYRDDPTILAWELANEPRCTNGRDFDAKSGWDADTLTAWAREMSEYVKSLDSHHLVSVGDEGFLARGGEHWAYRASDGVDHAALTALPHVDFGTFHLYPEAWGVSESFSERWIQDHVELARRLGKPTILEEFGLEASAGSERRERAYRRWNDVLLERGGNASLAWVLAATSGRGQRLPDHDRFAFYRDDAIGALLRSYSNAFARAPACEAPPGRRLAASPFVGVTRALASESGWVAGAPR